MKSVFVYYSLTGNGDFVASLFAGKGIDVIKLETEHRLPHHFLPLMMVGGAQALFHHKSKLKKERFDLSAYDRIILGTPVWNARTAPAMNAFLKKNSLIGKEIALVLISGSGDAQKCEASFRKRFALVSVLSLKEPLSNQDATKTALNNSGFY